MNAKKFTVIGLLSIVALFFYLGMNAYQSRVQTAQDVQVKAEQTRLVRMHSPVFGPQNAPVTIVEFFDPACAPQPQHLLDFLIASRSLSQWISSGCTVAAWSVMISWCSTCHGLCWHR